MQLPSSKEGIAKKLLLLYNGPYIIVKNNNNNTYVISDVETKKIKGTYNQVSLKMYYEPNKRSWIPQNSKEIVRSTYN